MEQDEAGLWQSALDYALRRWPILPVHSVKGGLCSCNGRAGCKPGKHPRTPNGFRDATVDPDAAAAWWRRWPDANIGVRTGRASGIFVLDVDVAGLDEWRRLLELHGEPGGWRVATGGGGEHRWFAVPSDTDIACRTSVATGIDVRGDGGYIIAPPSLHASGSRYAWKSPSAPADRTPPAPPAWIVDLVARPRELRDPGRAARRPEDEEVELLRDALRHVDADDYTTWVNVGLALKAAGLGRAEAIWSEWSTRSAKFSTAESERKWHDLKPDGRIGIGSIYQLAEAGGWKAPWRVNGGPSVGSVGSVGSNSGPSPRFRELRPLPAELPPVAAFDPDLLPASLRGWVVDIAERMQCPADFPAAGAIVGYGSVVGRRIAIRPKRHDDWLVVPNLWGALIGRPGIMKTPALQQAIAPVTKLEIAAKEEFDLQLADSAARRLVGKQKTKLDEKAIKETLEESGVAAAEAVAKQLNAETAALLRLPVRKRYIVNDCTVERLGVILGENPNGVLQLRDELVGWLRTLDREHQKPARAFFLEAWDGDGRFTYDRIERGTLDIEAATVSVLGGIQPGPFQVYLSHAAEAGQADDGLVQRLQVAVWPDIGPEWRNVDRWPDTPARNRAWEAFQAAAALLPGDVRAVTDGGTKIPFLGFDDAAQELFDAWRGELEVRLRAGTQSATFESHIAKYRSLVPSLALLLHLADGGQNPVGRLALEKAIALSAYLETHARRMYSAVVDPGVRAAHVIAQKIQTGKLRDSFAARDCYRTGWSGVPDASVAGAGIELLIEIGWLAEEVRPTGGRDATIYRINPAVLEAARGHADKADKADKSPSGAEPRRDKREADGADSADRTPSVGSGGSVSPDSQPARGCDRVQQVAQQEEVF